MYTLSLEAFAQIANYPYYPILPLWDSYLGFVYLLFGCLNRFYVKLITSHVYLVVWRLFNAELVRGFVYPKNSDNPILYYLRLVSAYSCTFLLAKSMLESVFIAFQMLRRAIRGIAANNRYPPFRRTLAFVFLVNGQIALLTFWSHISDSNLFAERLTPLWINTLDVLSWIKESYLGWLNRLLWIGATCYIIATVNPGL